MINDRFLTQTYTISNHPLGDYEELIQRKYLKALGEFLCFITNADQKAKQIYELWANSIVTINISGNWNFTPNFEYLKDSLYYDKFDNRHQLLRVSLIFDCFYLIEKTNSDFLEKSYIFLSRKVKANFTENLLVHVYEYFVGANNGEMIPNILRNHRQSDLEFLKKPLKKVLVVATMSAGKSTLINALIGNKMNKVASTVCTNKIRIVHNKHADEGAILELADQRFVFTDHHKIAQHDSVVNVGAHFQSFLSQEHICLIDTPGVNYNGDHSHGEMTRNAVLAKDYDALLFVSDATQFLTNDEASFLEFVIRNSKKNIIFCLNQCDSFDPDNDSINETISIWRQILAKINIKEPNIVTTTALGALLLRMEKQSAELTRTELKQLQSFKEDISDSFYHLEQYCSNKVDGNDDILIHTGILNLEALLYEKCKY